MDSQVIGIALTAAVGIAGILSTHLLARSQRKDDAARLRAERVDRYSFAEFESRSVLYADFLAELRSLIMAIRLRLTVTGSFRRTYLEEMEKRSRERAERLRGESTDPEFAEAMTQFLAALDRDPSLPARMAGTDDGTLPPAVDFMPIVRRLTELSARISLVGGADAATAARRAEAVALSTMLRLEAMEKRNLRGELSVDELEGAIGSMEEASIYELRLLPFGEKSSLDDLREAAKRDLVADRDDQGRKSNSDGV